MLAAYSLGCTVEFSAGICFRMCLWFQIEDDTERQITYGELYRSIRRVASALHDRGFKKKDILCIYSGKCNTSGYQGSGGKTVSAI